MNELVFMLYCTFQKSTFFNVIALIRSYHKIFERCIIITYVITVNALELLKS